MSAKIFVFIFLFLVHFLKGMELALNYIPAEITLNIVCQLFNFGDEITIEKIESAKKRPALFG